MVALCAGSCVGLLLGLAVVGCSKVPPEEGHTVSWYMAKENRTLSIQKQIWCKDDAGRLTTDDCRNAIEANRKSDLLKPNIGDNLKLP